MDKINIRDQVSDTYNRQAYNTIVTKIEQQINKAADGYIFPAKRITTSETMTLNDAAVMVDATSGNVIYTLQPALMWEQKRLSIKKIDASVNTVTITANGAELIDGAATKVIALQYGVVEIISQGGSVWII